VIPAITSEVTKGGTVQLRGSARFRRARAPRGSAEIRIPAAKTVKFTAGKAFKDAVNGV